MQWLYADKLILLKKFILYNRSAIFDDLIRLFGYLYLLDCMMLTFCISLSVVLKAV